METYATYAAWKNDQTTENQKLISALQRVIKVTAPHLIKISKWGQGCWVDGDEPKIYVHAEDGYVQLGFYHGASLRDSRKQLEGDGKFIRYITICAINDIATTGAADYIAQASVVS